MISVIVPVYNVEKYIEQCIDSVLNQTFSDFEVILVNDGSIDGSGGICDRIAEKSDKILVIHKENGGQNSAIKLGLEKAIGEYICFVDSDDWLEPDALEKLYNIMEPVKADLAIGNAFRNGDTEADFPLHYCKEGLYEREEIEEFVLPNLLTRTNQKYVSITPSRWGRLFRKDLIMQVLQYCDDSIRRGEDKLLTYPYIVKCEKIAFTNAKTYHYRYNRASISHSFCSDRMEEQKKLIRLLKNALSELTDYDFGTQYEAMTVEAVDMTIGELRHQIYTDDRKKVYKVFEKAIKDDIVSKKYHPFPRRLLEHIKFHLIMNRNVKILWFYNKVWQILYMNVPIVIRKL